MTPESPSSRPGALTAGPSGPLMGELALPGDRGLASRALALGALAIGETVVEGVGGTAGLDDFCQALQAFGASVAIEEGGGRIALRGLGVGGLLEPDDIVDCGTGLAAAELLAGLAAGHGFTTTLTGAASLRAEPLGRLLEPLRRMGVTAVARSRDRLPLSLRGADTPLPADLRLAAGSPKAALLLAALSAPGVTSLAEAEAVHDPIETLLPAFGAALEIEEAADGGRVLRLEGRRDLTPQRIAVAGDMALAALPLVAALVVDGSSVTLRGVAAGPARLALVETLLDMGAAIALSDRRMAAGEAVADLVVAASALKGIDIRAPRAARLIEALPILAVAAAFAEGRTVIEGLGALRQRAPDPVARLAAALSRCGVACEEGPESLAITGSRQPAGGARIEAGGDATLAMAMLVLGLGARAAVTLDDDAPLAGAFPGFAAAMRGLGAAIGPAELTAS